MFKFSKRVPADGTDAVGAILKAAADPKIISFAGGLPAPELFPVEGMKKATDKVYAEHGQQALQYGAAKGVTELRELILKRVKEKENVDAKLENVMVTTGSEQAIDLVGKAFVNPGDTVLVEEPTYLCALDVFRSYGANFVSVPMDEDGMKMDALEEALKAHPETALVYTVPNFQNPTGRTMPAERRKKFAELAAKYDVPVLEDNPYGDIRFAGEHVPSVKSFDHADNLVQYVVTEFFKENDVDAHVKEISDLYGKRKQLMIDGIKKYFPKDVKYTDPEGGMFLWVEVPGVTDTVELFKQCLEHNVAFVPGDPFFAGKPQPGTFRLNYSNMQEDQIEVGLKRLGEALSQALEA